MNSISDIPVLYFPFSRPHYARQTFEAIKKAQPKKFYFYCDKAREENEEEIKNNKIIRDFIKEVDWDCELKTWFRDENIGAYGSIMNAIDWFFEYEEMGIILEEDCLASLAFFDFCKQLLSKYKDDKRVWCVSGNNFIEGYNPNGYDYIFSAAFRQWGWATWKSRWQNINRDGFNISEILRYKLNQQYFGSSYAGMVADYKLKLEQNERGYWKPKSWDYLFQLSMRCNGGLAIIPLCNLVSNIGTVGLNSKKINKFIHHKTLPDKPNYIIQQHPPFVLSDVKYSTKHIQANNKWFFIKKIKFEMKRILRGLVSNQV